MNEVVIAQENIIATIQPSPSPLTVTVAGKNRVGYHVNPPLTDTQRATVSIEVPAESLIEIISFVGRNSTAARGQLDFQIWDWDLSRGSTIKWLLPGNTFDEFFLDSPVRIKISASNLFLIGANSCVVGDVLQCTMMYNLLRRGLG